MPDTGNTNVFTVFKGRYNLTPTLNGVTDNTVVMLTCVNDVQILGDFNLTNYEATNIIFELPNECKPLKEVALPVIIHTGVNFEDYELKILIITNKGKAFLTTSQQGNSLLMLSGVNFNISDNWY